MIKAVFFDIDGTLISFKTHRARQSVFEAFERARARGVKLIAATGRNVVAVEEGEVLSHLPRFDGYVVMNGSYCYVGDTVVFSQPIDRRDVARMVELAERVPFGCKFAERDRYYVNRYTDTVLKYHDEIHIKLPQLVDISRALEHDVYSVTPYLAEGQEQLFAQALEHSETTRWHPRIVDVVPRGVGKHIGLERMAAHFGVDVSETMALGDGHNDLTMVERAGVGVAMANACDELKAAADYIAPDPDADGVFAALERFGVI